MYNQWNLGVYALSKLIMRAIKQGSSGNKNKRQKAMHMVEIGVNSISIGGAAHKNGSVETKSQTFIEKIKSLKNNLAGPLLDLINPSIIILTVKQLQNIYQSIIEYHQWADKNSIINFEAINEINIEELSEQQLLKFQEDLFAGKYGIRIAKNTGFGNDRTVNVINMHGSLRLMVLTNLKTAVEGGLKNFSAFLGMGLYKNVKLCWDLTDSNPIPMCRAQVEITDVEKFKVILQEVKRSQEYDSPYIAKLHVGGLYEHTKNGETSSGIYLYSELALCNLANIYKYLTPDELKQIELEKKSGKFPQILNKLMFDAIRGLAVIHAAGHIHRDVKLENILVFRDRNGNLSAKLSDLSEVKEVHEQSRPQATLDYASPQVFAGNTDQKYFFPTDNTEPTYNLLTVGRQMYEDMLEEGLISNQKIVADQADDMFAIGICIVSLLIKQPVYVIDAGNNRNFLTALIKTFKATSGTISALLDSKRENRPSCAECTQHKANTHKMGF